MFLTMMTQLWELVLMQNVSDHDDPAMGACIDHDDPAMGAGMDAECF